MIARRLEWADSGARASFEALGTVILVLLALAFALRSPVPNPGMQSGDDATRMALGCAAHSQEAT